MTINHPVRRLLARVCSPETMARVVDPTLADMRVEGHRWYGYVALLRALTFHAVTSIPGTLARVYWDDDRAVPRAAMFSVACALVAALPFVAPPLLTSLPRPSPVSNPVLLLLVLPQALVLTLPAGLLLGVPVALRSRHASRTLHRRVMAVALGCLLATASVMVWGVPGANQAFRVMISRQVKGADLEPGPAEMSFSALRNRIEILERTPERQSEARGLAFVYSMRIALTAAPLPIGVIAIGLASTAVGRRRPWLIGAGAVTLYVSTLFPLYGTAETLMRGSSLPPMLFAWLPMTILVLVAGVGRTQRVAA